MTDRTKHFLRVAAAFMVGAICGALGVMLSGSELPHGKVVSCKTDASGLILVYEDGTFEIAAVKGNVTGRRLFLPHGLSPRGEWEIAAKRIEQTEQ